MRPSSTQPGRAISLLIVIAFLLSACGNDLWGSYDSTITPPPVSTGASPAALQTVPTQSASTVTPFPTLDASPIPTVATDLAPAGTPPTDTPTPFTSTSVPGATISYTSQSGDSLGVVAVHFGVSPSEISSSGPLPSTGFINPGTLLFLPNHLLQTPTTPTQPIIPDSELVDSPSAVGFDIASYVDSAGGYLSTFTDYHNPVGTISGADAVQIISVGSSISPRLILALIQYYTGWVQGQPKPGLDEKTLFGYKYPSYNPNTPTLYQPMRPAIQDLLTGYYGWRAGNLSSLTFPDGTSLRIAPGLNAGSVALQYFFSKQLNYADWLQAINPDTGFLSLYKSMFGDPWVRANELGPLFPSNLIQPSFTLPFEVGTLWALTGGPHPAWEAESAWGALDFAPAAAVSGCAVSNAWAVAVAPGQIVRSESSYVVLDLDGDGFEQTGWVVIYQHIATNDRIPAGTQVAAGARIGHPSCEGGEATGTNLHIARKYNGEWVAAGGPLPFDLSGWIAHEGSAPYQGTLTKDGQTVVANQTGTHESQIIRKPGE
jgi:LasA protease